MSGDGAVRLIQKHKTFTKWNAAWMLAIQRCPWENAFSAKPHRSVRELRSRSTRWESRTLDKVDWAPENARRLASTDRDRVCWKWPRGERARHAHLFTNKPRSLPCWHGIIGCGRAKLDESSPIVIEYFRVHYAFDTTEVVSMNRGPKITTFLHEKFTRHAHFNVKWDLFTSVLNVLLHSGKPVKSRRSSELKKLYFYWTVFVSYVRAHPPVNVMQRTAPQKQHVHQSQ